MLDTRKVFEQLKAPFDPNLLHWRPGATSGNKAIALAYLNARDVMKRLDDVCGLDWQCRYPFEGCCEIGLKTDEGWVWRANGAGETQIEAVKGQYSQAFVRAGAVWGIGRYLYYLPNTWVELNERKQIIQPPDLPSWALPKPSTGEQNG